MASFPANQIAHSPTIDQNRNLNGIDLIKFFCAIMVFVVHVAPFRTDVSPITDNINFALLQCLCRVAVPFYFVCSGYFLFRKMPIDDLNVDFIKSYCYKILRLFATWSLLLFFGPTDQLWYLSGTVVAVVLLSLCFHFRMKYGVICLLSCLLYAIGLLGDSYHGLIPPFAEISVIRALRSIYIRFFETTRNGIFMGSIFVFMGACFSHRKVHLKPSTAAIAFLLSMVCLLIETYLLEFHHIPIEYNMFVSLLPAVYFLFSFAYTVPLKNRTIYKHLRNIGVWFYFLHLAASRAVYLSTGWLDQHFNTGIFNPVFVFALPLTLLIAVALDWLSGKEKFNWLNWLIA